MTATTLLLVRHGQTDWNLARRYQGQHDIPLNGTGIFEAHKAAGALKSEKLDGIICSDLARAKRTGELIATFHDVPFSTDARLREISFGAWEGLSWSEIEEQFPDEAVAWRKNTMAGPPDGETFAQLAERTKSFVESMRGRGGRYVIASHGGTIRSIVAACLGLAPERSWQFQIKNVSIAELVLYDGATVLNRWNDTHHLQSKGKIRPISIALIQHEGHILVAEGFTPENNQPFYRPLGGGIEFGETGEQALRREITEELGAELATVDYFKTVENIFVYDGEGGHEIVQIFHATFADSTRYDLTREHLVVEEGFRAVWMPIDGFRRDDAPPLYPDGLLALLTDG